VQVCVHVASTGIWPSRQKAAKKQQQLHSSCPSNVKKSRRAARFRNTQSYRKLVCSRVTNTPSNLNVSVIKYHKFGQPLPPAPHLSRKHAFEHVASILPAAAGNSSSSSAKAWGAGEEGWIADCPTKDDCRVQGTAVGQLLGGTWVFETADVSIQ